MPADAGTPPVRVAVFRSSRFLALAVCRARAHWPGCEIAIVHQAGHEAEAAGADVALTYTATVRFRVHGWLRSSTRAALRVWKPDAVVIQLQDESGSSALELGLVALLAGGGRFWYVLPDGTLRATDSAAWLRRVPWHAARQLRNHAIAAAVLVATALTVPAWLVARARWAVGHRVPIGRGER